MSRASDPPASRSSSPETTEASSSHVCPFCGEEQLSKGRLPEAPCPRCGTIDTSTARKAARSSVGPWQVRQSRNPWSAGMKFEALVGMIRRGQVTAATVVRGPTTQQLWKRASRVRGLSREFGLCYHCGKPVSRDDRTCAHCNRIQEPASDRDALLETRQLAPVRRELKTSEAAATAPASDGAGAGRIVLRNSNIPPERPGDALLTPQEVATAFKLELAQGPSGLRMSRGRRVMLAGIMLLVGVGALAYFMPEWRESAVQWIADQYEVVTAPAPEQETTVEQPAAPVPRDPAPVVEQRPPAVVEPPPAPLVTETPRTVEPAPPPPPPVVIERPAPRPPVVEDALVPVVDPLEQARTLWRQAIDAEANQDFVEAVRCYELIRKLPRHVHPSGLEVRLNNARRQLP